jgi:hypothetical protein
MLTTLSTNGYGDIYPTLSFEKLIIIPIMIFGVTFFSFLMGSFSEIVNDLKANAGDESLNDDSIEMTQWVDHLGRFRNDIPINPILLEKINDNYKVQMSKNRLK